MSYPVRAEGLGKYDNVILLITRHKWIDHCIQQPGTWSRRSHIDHLRQFYQKYLYSLIVFWQIILNIIWSYFNSIRECWLPRSWNIFLLSWDSEIKFFFYIFSNFSSYAFLLVWFGFFVEWYICYVLTFWPGQKCHSRWCTGRKWYILMAVMRANRVGGNWLMKWDEHEKFPWYTTEWCTGREWPLNCMTVISAWWRLNIWFQRSSGRRTIIWLSWVRRARAVASRVPDS